MLKIRKAGLKDILLIVKLWEEFMCYHDDVIIKNNSKLKYYQKKRKDASEKFAWFIRKNIRSKDGVVHIAEVDGDVAGYSLIFIKDNIPVFELEKLGYLSDLFVRKQYRGSGISSALKDEAIRWFRKKGIKHLSIAVYKDNPLAHSIYQKWGFFDYHIEMRKKL